MARQAVGVKHAVSLPKRAALRFPRAAAMYRLLARHRRRVARRAGVAAEPLISWGRRQPVGPLIRRAITTLRGRAAIAVVPADRLLLGSDNGLTADDDARLRRDLPVSSTPLPRWPHVRLLEQLLDHGQTVITRELLVDSPYWHHARGAIASVGHYLGAVDETGISERARELVLRLSPGLRAKGRHGPALDPDVRVRRIRASDCYEVVSGHYRLAADYVLGSRDATVIVEPGSVWTPLQRMLRQMSWLEGRRELYQPIDSPELEKEWILVRRCTDRLAYMTAFLSRLGMMGSGSLKYLDVGSCYGWFVSEMLRLGFDAWGMERDRLAPVLGEAMYSLDRHRVLVGDCADLLKGYPVTDVVSCFSVVHHFAAGQGSCSAEELIARISKVTGRVLFFDSGESHEAWFADSLRGWSPDFIQDWLRSHTDFDEIHRLGTDHDAVAPFQDNYGRTLFACVRSKTD
jgi:hypothetical protein